MMVYCIQEAEIWKPEELFQFQKYWISVTLAQTVEYQKSFWFQLMVLLFPQQKEKL